MRNFFAKAMIKPVRQRTQFSCMATSMCMALQALGHQCDEDEVNQVMGATPTRGAAWEQALATAQHYGCRATLTTPSTVTQLREWTDKGAPVMISWNPEGRDWSHASVVFDVTDGLPEGGLPPYCAGYGDLTGRCVWVADSNMPNPEKLVRVCGEDFFYSKWSEKWPSYLVRRVACAIEREITPEGRQVMAGCRPPTMDRLRRENLSAGRPASLDPLRVLSRYMAARGKSAGADFFSVWGRGSDPKKVFEDLRASAESEARFEAEEEGEDYEGYSGTIAEKHGFKVRDRKPRTLREARNFAYEDGDNNDKWGPAFAVPVPGGWLFYGYASS